MFEQELPGTDCENTSQWYWNSKRVTVKIRLNESEKQAGQQHPRETLQSNVTDKAIMVLLLLYKLLMGLKF